MSIADYVEENLNNNAPPNLNDFATDFKQLLDEYEVTITSPFSIVIDGQEVTFVRPDKG